MLRSRLRKPTAARSTTSSSSFSIRTALNYDGWPWVEIHGCHACLFLHDNYNHSFSVLVSYEHHKTSHWESLAGQELVICLYRSQSDLELYFTKMIKACCTFSTSQSTSSSRYKVSPSTCSIWAFQLSGTSSWASPSSQDCSSWYGERSLKRDNFSTTSTCEIN